MKIQIEIKFRNGLDFTKQLTVIVGDFVNKVSHITMITPMMMPIPAPTHGTRLPSVFFFQSKKYNFLSILWRTVCHLMKLTNCILITELGNPFGGVQNAYIIRL